jgi:uncharacterized phiE125 gp8 family phage protein
VLRLVTPPVVEPVTLLQAKPRLHYTADDYDFQIMDLLRMARQELDGPTGRLRRALLTQTWEMLLDDLPRSGMLVPLPPLQTITSLTYLDLDGVAQTLASNQYRLVLRGLEPAWLEPAFGATWPGVRTGLGAATLKFVCGWSTPDQVPEPLKTWIIARAGAMLAQPESAIVGVSAMHLTYFDAILHPFQIYFT